MVENQTEGSAYETNERRVFGPPGTGKTTYLKRQVERAAQKFGSEEIMVASFTRTAAIELTSRQLPIPEENIGTVHAHCYRAMGFPEIAELHVAEFNESYPHFTLSSGKSGKSKIDECAADIEFKTDGDKHMAEYNKHRAQCLSLETLPKPVFSFMKAWESWKLANDYIDFTDMIQYTIMGKAPPPKNCSVGIYDECFPGDVFVTMHDGTQCAISELVEKRSHEQVLSLNHKTGKIEAKHIIGWYKHPLKNRQLLDSQFLRATDNHPIFTKTGYMEFKKCLDLDTVEVLQLNHEKIQRNRMLDGNRAIDHHRITTWRRLNKQKSRKKQQCKSQILSRHRTIDLSTVEISESSTMGQNAAIQGTCNRIWRTCQRFYDNIASYFYKTLAYHVSRSRQSHQAHYAIVNPANERSCFSCLVHGRRRFTVCDGQDQHVRIFSGRSGINDRIFKQTWFFLQGLLRKTKGTNHHIFINGSKPFNEGNLSVHPSAFSLQSPAECFEGKTNHDSSSDYLRTTTSKNMSILRSNVYSTQITKILRKTYVLFGKYAKLAKKMESTKSSAQRNNLRKMHYLQQGISKDTIYSTISQRTHQETSNMQSHLSSSLDCTSKAKQEEWVYCLDIEDNHNFFANGILVHNCQDFSRLETRLIRMWAQHQKLVIMAGDDDQLLFSFTGATPDAFLEPPIPEQFKRVLSQSWRVPRKVQEHADRWIKQVAKREQKAYKPRDFDGEVRWLNKGNFRVPNYIIDEAQEYLARNKKVMFLTTCGYMLSQIKDILKNEGVPFYNPYRRTRGDWNPLGYSTAKQTSSKDRILAFLRDSGISNTHGKFWNMEELQKWIPLLRSEGVFIKGKRRAFDRWLEDEHGLSYSYDIHEIMSQHMEPDALKAALTRDLDWLERSMAKAKLTGTEYPLKVLKKHGRNALEDSPKIIISTIHGVKGGEADAVFVFPDLSLNAMQEWIQPGEGHDSIIRTFYVGMTRARESLIICPPASRLTVSLH